MFGFGFGFGRQQSKGAAVASPDLPTPIAFWAFDEASGTRVGTHGAPDLLVTGTVGASAGKVNNAVHLGGSDIGSLMTDPGLTPTFLVGTNVLYVAGWFYATTLQNSNQGSIIFVIQGDEFPYFGLIPSFNGLSLTIDLNVTMSEGMGGSISSAALSSGEWYFYEAYVDPSSNEIGLRLNRGAWTTSTAGDTTFGANVGERIFGPASNLAGYNDDYLHDAIGLYDHILTNAESAALYNSGAGAQV